MLHAFRRDWLSNTRGDLLSGLVVALALIPEAIAFSIIAGVDPKVGLYASFCIAVVIAITVARQSSCEPQGSRLSKVCRFSPAIEVAGASRLGQYVEQPC